jgi:hypothetical protein
MSSLAAPHLDEAMGRRASDAWPGKAIPKLDG